MFLCISGIFDLGAKAVAKAGQVLTYDVPKRKLPDWVAEQFARTGGKAEPDACRALLDIVGKGFQRKRQQVEINSLRLQPAGGVADADNPGVCPGAPVVSLLGRGVKLSAVKLPQM